MRLRRKPPSTALFGSRRFLVVYSGVVTAAFALTVLTGMADPDPRRATFDEIDVEHARLPAP